MLLHVVAEVFDQGDLLFELSRVVVNGEELLVVVLVDVLASNGVLVEDDARLIVEKNTN